MRCLTLAEALRAKGAEVWFVSRAHEGHLGGIIEGRGFRLLVLPSSGTAKIITEADFLAVSWERDVEDTAAALDGAGVHPDWLVVDHYGIDVRWERAMRQHAAAVMVIDDMADREHDCDLLLDQNLIVGMTSRYAGKVPLHCGVMVGPRYALLHPVYADLHPSMPPRSGPVGRILVSFGGADLGNITGRVIGAFLALGRSDIVMDVIVDPRHSHRAAMDVRVRGSGNVRLHSSLPSLAPLMARADLAIGGAGATSWERVCLGLPALVVSLAQNQRPIAEGLQARGLARWLGDQEMVDETLLVAEIGKVIATGLDEAWSLRCLETMDGRGVDQVCAALMVDTRGLRVRRAKLEDEALVEEWAAMPVASGLRPVTPISVAEFRNCLRDIDDCRLYMVASAAGVDLGLVRFSRQGVRWRVSDIARQPLRSRDFATPMLRAALLRLRAEIEGVIELVPSADPERAPEATPLVIHVCSESSGWVDETIADLLIEWNRAGHSVAWGHEAESLPEGDLCFFLSYGRIVKPGILARHAHNLVVHASDLPKGRGWSPLTWQILEGENRIPVTLIEAAAEVDSGVIYKQSQAVFSGGELVDELRAAVAEITRELCAEFVAEYPTVLREARPQAGTPTFYPRRRPKDSWFDIDRTVREQFNLLRTADAARYPAWFEIGETRYAIVVEKRDQ